MAALRHDPISLSEVQAAQRRISGRVVRTPVVTLNFEDAPAEIYLKLENLQRIGSFKIRGAINVVDQMSAVELRDGVWTASAGNMAQALAWCAREKAIPCTVVVPETASLAKLNAMRRLGASIVPVSLEEFFETFSARQRPGMSGTFVHAFSDRRMMAGNGTIGLEILDDLPDVDALAVRAAARTRLSRVRGIVMFFRTSVTMDEKIHTRARALHTQPAPAKRNSTLSSCLVRGTSFSRLPLRQQPPRPPGQASVETYLSRTTQNRRHLQQ